MRRWALFILALCITVINCTTMEMHPLVYDINVTVFTHGTHKLYYYRLTGDKILGVQYPHNQGPEKILVDRPLNDHEKLKFKTLFEGFPIKQLKNEYVNNQVEGEIHRVFDIKIRDEHKEIYVYFYEQKDIDGLMDEILKLMP